MKIWGESMEQNTIREVLLMLAGIIAILNGFFDAPWWLVSVYWFVVMMYWGTGGNNEDNA